MRATQTIAVSFVALLAATSLAVGGAAMPDGDSDVAGAPAASCVGAPQTTADAQNLSMAPLTAPTGTYDDLRNASAVRDAMAADRLVSADVDEQYIDHRVAMGDVVVVEVRLNGSATALLDRMAAQEEGSPTANFRALVQERGIDLTFRGPSACPPELALNESVERGAIRAVPDDQRNALYVVFDTDRFLVDPLGDDSEPTATDWKTGRNSLELEVKTTSGLVEQNVTASTAWDLSDRRAEFRTDTPELVRVEAGVEQFLNGTATMAPGTELAIDLRPLDGGETRTASATVRADRTFATSVQVPRGVYAVNVSDAFEGDTLLVAGNATGAVLTFDTYGNTGDTLYGISTTTTDGGFVVVTNETGARVVASSKFDAGARAVRLDVPQSHQRNQTLTATVYHDVDGDGTLDAADEPYRANGAPIRASANVTYVPQETTTAPTSTPDSSTSTTAPTSETNDPTTPTDSEAPRSSPSDESGATTPGLGASTALVALVVVAGFTVRRT